jgi:hypothetical protein
VGTTATLSRQAWAPAYGTWLTSSVSRSASSHC